MHPSPSRACTNAKLVSLSCCISLYTLRLAQAILAGTVRKICGGRPVQTRRASRRWPACAHSAHCSCNVSTRDDFNQIANSYTLAASSPLFFVSLRGASSLAEMGLSVSLPRPPNVLTHVSYCTCVERLRARQSCPNFHFALWPVCPCWRHCPTQAGGWWPCRGKISVKTRRHCLDRACAEHSSPGRPGFSAPPFPSIRASPPAPQGNT